MAKAVYYSIREILNKKSSWSVYLIVYIFKKRQLVLKIAVVFYKNCLPYKGQRAVVLIAVYYFLCNIISKYKRCIWQFF